jgi:acyl-coenzyme A thioesterase PaaI-like protein
MGMTALRASGNKPHATIELNIQFVGAVRLGEFVEAHCEVVRLTRAIIFMQSGRHARGGERDGDLEDPR